MGRRFGVSYEERLDAVEMYLRHDCSRKYLDKRLKVDKTGFREWTARYRSFGAEGLQDCVDA